MMSNIFFFAVLYTLFQCSWGKWFFHLKHSVAYLLWLITFVCGGSQRTFVCSAILSLLVFFWDGLFTSKQRCIKPGRAFSAVYFHSVLVSGEAGPSSRGVQRFLLCWECRFDTSHVFPSEKSVKNSDTHMSTHTQTQTHTLTQIGVDLM